MSSDHIHQGYARALFEMAQAEGVVNEVEQQLFQLHELLRQTPELLKFLKDPNIKREGKRQALAEIFEGRVAAVLLNAMLALSDSDRAGEIVKVIDAFRDISAAAKERITGQVTTAISLDSGLRERLQNALGQLTGKQVELFERIDPSILGGAVIQVGEQVIDGSLRRKLDLLSEQLRK